MMVANKSEGCTPNDEGGLSTYWKMGFLASLEMAKRAISAFL